jgi:two-component system alkaline phosphatase synthesis response regulator PhoP
MQGNHAGFDEAILVADDSVTILAMVSARLGRGGHEVITAARGDDALALARERHPRLVVLDVEMPGLDGIEVTEQIRADPALVGTLVILLTGNANPEHVNAGMVAGADAYVTKPFSPQALELEIDRLLGRS